MPNRFALIETEPMVELRGRKESASTAFRSVALFWFAGSLFFALPLEAREDGLQSLQLPPMSVESEPAPEMGFELPPPAYPLQPVDQLPSQGARHGLVNTTKGNLVFRVTDLRLGGRMPIEFARVYDSSSASPPLMTVPPVSLPKWAEDLGSNWITSYSAYLLPVFLQDPNSPPPFVAVGVTLPNGVLMATPDGDRLYWVEGADGVFRPWRDVPSRHMKLVRETTTRIVETQLDGTRWTYSLQPGAVSQYVLTRIQDRSGNAIILTYQNSYLFRIENTDGAWIEIRRPMFDTGSPSGGVQSFPPSRIVEIMDSTNRSVHFSYTLDALGRLTAAADALGNPWTYGYDSSGRLVSANDPLNNTYLTASYDATGRIQSYEANAGVWSFEYPAASNITRATDALENTWQYTRSGSTGITTWIQEPTGGAHQFKLDSANNPVRYVGPEGESATWTYDAKHRMTAVQPPGSNGSSITYSYDSSAGWVNSMTALDGGVTTFARDSSGRVIQETDPMNGWWTSTYSGLGDRLTLRLPNGNAAGGNGYQWSFTYDGLGNVVTAKDPLNREFHLEYTAQGDLRTMKRPDVSRLDPSTGTVHPFPVEWRYERDVLGRITSTTDPEGRTWTHTYDAAGRLVHVAGPATHLRYGYDDRSRLAEVVVEPDGSKGPRTAFS